MAIGFFGILNSCNKEPKTVGIDMLKSEELKIGLDTTNFIHAHSFRVDSIITLNKGVYPIGSILDANFGQLQSNIYFEMRPPRELTDSFYCEKIIDSVVLELSVSSFYGDITSNQHFHVYQLADTIDVEKTYYSTQTIPLDIDKGELGNVTINPLDLINSEEETKTIRIPLNNESVGEYIFCMGRDILDSGSAFEHNFKGLAILSEPQQAVDKGGIVYIDFSTYVPKLIIYYNGTSEFVASVRTGTTSSFANYKHNYIVSQDEVFKQEILDEDLSKGSENIYIEGMTGIKSLITFPGLMDWVGERKIFIHQATLTLPVDKSENPFSLPQQLKLLMKDTDSTSVSLPDEARGTLIGGTYSQLNNKYEYIITLYIQELVNGREDLGLIFSMDGDSYRPDRVKFFGTNPDLENNIQLKIIYTEL